MEVLRFFLIVMAAGAMTPVAIYCLEVLAGCRRPRSRPKEKAGLSRPRVAVLIPAHNEAAGIAATVKNLKPQLGRSDKLVVVADNCSDDTAAVAQQAGAVVLERQDEMRRGKGFALAFGLDKLFSDPPDVVVFVDADCRLSPGSVEHLAQAAHSRQRPTQALNLCEPTEGGGLAQLISGLAFRFKNLIRMTGIARLGGPCHLTGTGMALPWKLVDKVAWATGNVVEDMQLGIELTLAGYPPLFVPEAEVRSDLPVSKSGVLSQRRRWEHGFLATALEEMPQLLAQAVERRSWALLVLALDLLVPPLALLSAFLVIAWLAALLAWYLGLGTMPLLVVSSGIAAFAGTTILGWRVHCPQFTPLKVCLGVPLYILAKLPLYLDFLFRREQQWVRAQRR